MVYDSCVLTQYDNIYVLVLLNNFTFLFSLINDSFGEFKLFTLRRSSIYLYVDDGVEFVLDCLFS